MEDASPATFRPTGRQALARGLYLGSLASAAGFAVAVLAALLLSWEGWIWVTAAFVPAPAGGVLGLLIVRRTGTQLNARGIRTLSAFTGDGLAPWGDVVDMRAERRGGRTVVSVYLDGGASVQLHAPYSGGFFAEDPQFESKMYALSNIWRSHRFGGLPG
jgi:hypothetical protein